MQGDTGPDRGDPASLARVRQDHLEPVLADLLLTAERSGEALAPERLRAIVDDILASGSFCRDTESGALLHPGGKIAFRQIARRDSLHVSIGEEDISVHVDRASPLSRTQKDAAGCGHCRYSTARVLRHLITNVVRRVAAVRPGATRRTKHIVISTVGTRADERTARRSPVRPGGVVLGDPAEAVFIRFSAIDEAVYLLDSPLEPWTVQIECRLAGRLDEARLRQALLDALARHPMTRARKVTDPVSPLVWEIPAGVQADPLQILTCRGDDALASIRDDFYSLSIPLSSSPPLRVRLVRHPGGDVIMLALHHAAVDAIGGLQWLRSVTGFYAGGMDGPGHAPAPQARDLPRLLGPRSLRCRLRQLVTAGAEVLRFSRGSSHLAGDGGCNRSGYGIYHRALPDELSRGLMARREGLEVTLLCGLHQALSAWNVEHGAPAERITVGWPVNMRPTSWKGERAGNFVCMVPITTLPADRSDAGALHQVIDQRLSQISKRGSAEAIVSLLGILRRILPFALKPAIVERITGNPFSPSAVLHHLGAVDGLTFGDAGGPVSQVWFSPPAMMPEALSIGVVTTGARVRLAFRYRQALWDSEEASRFADLYAASLAGLLEDDPARRGLTGRRPARWWSA